MVSSTVSHIYAIAGDASMPPPSSAPVSSSVPSPTPRAFSRTTSLTSQTRTAPVIAQTLAQPLTAVSTSHRGFSRTKSLPAQPSTKQPLAQLSQSAVNALPSSSAPSVGQNAGTHPDEYRLPWGKHKGKLLSDVPADYLSWLKNTSDAYKSNKALQIAVEHHMSAAIKQKAPYVTPTPLQLPLPAYVPPSSAPSPGALQLTAPSPSSFPAGPYVLTFGKHAGQALKDVPPAYVAWLKTAPMYETHTELRTAVALWEQIPRVYRLTFGKHVGSTLDEVPPSYLNWLHEFDAPVGHDDLRKALADHRAANAASQIAAATSSTPKSRKKPWVIPDEHTSDHRRYYYNGDRKSGQMWIGCHDVVRYFGADPKAMTAAGLRPHHRNQRFWLHQVFSYA